MMRRMVVMVTGVGLAIAAASAKPTGIKTTGSENAADILRKSQAAMKKVQYARYRAQYRGTGWVARFVADLDGTTISGPRSKWDIDSFRSEVTLTAHRETKPLRFTAGCNGDIFFLIDPKTKTAYEDMDQAVLGTHGRDLQRLLMTAFNEDEPYGKDLDAAEMTGEETVEGVPCKIVRVKDKEGTEVEWFIATTDYLPRRRRRIIANRQNTADPPGTTELTIADLIVNPKLEGNPFELTLPAGFTKSNDFAP